MFVHQRVRGHIVAAIAWGLCEQIYVNPLLEGKELNPQSRAGVALQGGEADAQELPSLQVPLRRREKNEQRSRTPLKEIFKINAARPNGPKYLYSEFPEHFLWDVRTKKCKD